MRQSASAIKCARCSGAEVLYNREGVETEDAARRLGDVELGPVATRSRAVPLPQYECGRVPVGPDEAAEPFSTAMRAPLRGRAFSIRRRIGVGLAVARKTRDRERVRGERPCSSLCLTSCTVAKRIPLT